MQSGSSIPHSQGLSNKSYPDLNSSSIIKVINKNKWKLLDKLQELTYSMYEL